MPKRRSEEEPLHPSYPGELDNNITAMYREQWQKCPKGHLNSPNAHICWKCGEPILKKREEGSSNPSS